MPDWRENSEILHPIPDGLREEEIHDPFWREKQETVQGGSYRVVWRARAPKAIELLSGDIGRLAAKLFPLSAIKSATAQLRAAAPTVRDALRRQLSSPEFWLGLGFGVATRLATRFSILSAFQDSPELATFASFVACACAGFVAGAVTHLVRTRYRNAKKSNPNEKERYAGRALFVSAAIGLFGGVLGGYVVNAGAVIANAGGFVVGTTAGAGAGLVYAGTKAMKARCRQQPQVAWRGLALQGAVFGALGGVLGIVFPELFAAHDSIAAPNIGPAPPAGVGTSYVQPASSSVSNPADYVKSLFKTATPSSQPPLLQATTTPVLQSLPPASSGPMMEADGAVTPTQPSAAFPEGHPIIHEHAHKAGQSFSHAHEHTHTYKHVHEHEHKDPCKTTGKARSLRHVKKLKHLKPKPEVIEKIVVIEKPAPLAPPPPPAPVPPVRIIPPLDPCSTGPCDDVAPCDPRVQLDIRGPCADPNTPCAERISFNETGEATHVVLEPQAQRIEGPIAQTSARYADGVDLVVPMTGHALASPYLPVPRPV